jgi:hypothetical protein
MNPQKNNDRSQNNPSSNFLTSVACSKIYRVADQSS